MAWTSILHRLKPLPVSITSGLWARSLLRAVHVFQSSKNLSYSLIQDYSGMNSNGHPCIGLSPLSPNAIRLLHFPEALLSLNILYLLIQPVAGSMKYLVHSFCFIYASTFAMTCGAVLYSLQGRHTATDCQNSLAHRPIASNL